VRWTPKQKGSRSSSRRERALQRTARLLTGDRALAEDLVQTALVRSWP
jgi:DNA-directed RNA polymerase specialized sigma24 family protein